MVDALVVTLLLRIVHRQQHRLRASEERYRALFEQARDGIGVVRLSDYQLVEANNKVCEVLGLRQQDCIQRDVRELLNMTSTNGHPEVAMLGGQASGEIEFTVRTPQGQSRPVSVSFTPLSADDEEVMILSLRDLSMRKQLEAERLLRNASPPLDARRRRSLMK